MYRWHCGDEPSEWHQACHIWACRSGELSSGNTLCDCPSRLNIVVIEKDWTSLTPVAAIAYSAIWGPAGNSSMLVACSAGGQKDQGRDMHRAQEESWSLPFSQVVSQVIGTSVTSQHTHEKFMNKMEAFDVMFLR